jgi:hypothetical protein
MKKRGGRKTTKVGSEAGRGLGHPEELTRAQERSLAGSVLSHLPRHPKKDPPRGGGRRSLRG